MRALIQVVQNAEVAVDNTTIGSCKRGFLIFLGVEDTDNEQLAKKLWDKIFKMRIFHDEDGKTNLSLSDIGGEVLIVSQFTLYANCRKGNRPSFTRAASPDHAKAIYKHFIDLAKMDVAHVGEGEFGADMQVSLVNDGPFTIWLDTEDLLKPKSAS